MDMVEKSYILAPSILIPPNDTSIHPPKDPGPLCPSKQVAGIADREEVSG